MLSLSKILFTALIVVVIWKGFKWLSRSQQPRQGDAPRQKRPSPKSKRQPAAQDLVRCANCGVYHADGANHICEG